MRTDGGREIVPASDTVTLDVGHMNTRVSCSFTALGLHNQALGDFLVPSQTDTHCLHLENDNVEVSTLHLQYENLLLRGK